MRFALVPRLAFGTRVFVGICCVVALGCGASTPPDVKDASPPAASASSPVASAAPVENAGSPAAAMVGSLSEEAFKALHQLKGEKAPPARGVRVTIDGTSAYLSLPPGKTGPLPGLVVVHEWWGLNEHIQHWADRLAEDGYAALAVDLYGGKVATTPDEAMATMKTVDEKKAIKTLVAAHDFLEKDERIKAPRTGAIGWCFGGGFSLKLAMNEPDLDAAVIYYGMLVSDPGALKPIKSEILGLFGNKDKSITPEKVNDFEKALGVAGVKNTIVRYDADHAFANPSQTRYDEKSAADAWAKVRQFFQTKLKPAL